MENAFAPPSLGFSSWRRHSLVAGRYFSFRPIGDELLPSRKCRSAILTGCPPPSRRPPFPPVLRSPSIFFERADSLVASLLVSHFFCCPVFLCSTFGLPFPRHRHIRAFFFRGTFLPCAATFLFCCPTRCSSSSHFARFFSKGPYEKWHSFDTARDWICAFGVGSHGPFSPPAGRALLISYSPFSLHKVFFFRRIRKRFFAIFFRKVYPPSLSPRPFLVSRSNPPKTK